MKVTMILQSYFNVLSKVGLIFPYYVSNFTSTSSMKRNRGKLFKKAFRNFKEQNIIVNKVLSRMSPFRDKNFGKMRPNFKCTVLFLQWSLVFLSLSVTLRTKLTLLLNVQCSNSNSYFQLH